MEQQQPGITYEHVIGTQTCEIFALRQQLEQAQARIQELEAMVSNGHVHEEEPAPNRQARRAAGKAN